MKIRRLLVVVLTAVSFHPASSQIPLRTKLGQMVMVTVTGDSVEESSASMDTLKRDLAENLVGGVVMFTWSGNLKSPGQIAHFADELQKRASIPLLLAIDQEGGLVARLSASNGFAATAIGVRSRNGSEPGRQHPDRCGNHGRLVRRRPA